MRKHEGKSGLEKKDGLTKARGSTLRKDGTRAWGAKPPPNQVKLHLQKLKKICGQILSKKGRMMKDWPQLTMEAHA